MVRVVRSAGGAAQRGGVVVRDVTAADLAVFYEQQIDPDATAMAAFPARQRRSFMDHWARILTDGTVKAKAIEVDGAIAGNIVSFVHEGRREVGYWLGKEFWGQGTATAALALFLAYERTRPLHAAVVKHNTGSIRVLQKCGFTVTGSDDDEILLTLY